MEQYFKAKKYSVEKKNMGYNKFIFAEIITLISIVASFVTFCVVVYVPITAIVLALCLLSLALFMAINYYKRLKLRKEQNEKLPEWVVEIYEDADSIRLNIDSQTSRDVDFKDIENIFLLENVKGDPKINSYELVTDRFDRLLVELKDGRVYLFKHVEGTKEELQRLKNRCKL